jgi:hypothetical protein
LCFVGENMCRMGMASLKGMAIAHDTHVLEYFFACL